MPMLESLAPMHKSIEVEPKTAVLILESLMLELRTNEVEALDPNARAWGY